LILISDSLHWCYKSVRQGVRQAILVLSKCHIRGPTGYTGVTKVSHKSYRLNRCYKSVTRVVRKAGYYADDTVYAKGTGSHLTDAEGV
jgi:hypothetical protein